MHEGHGGRPIRRGRHGLHVEQHKHHPSTCVVAQTVSLAKRKLQLSPKRRNLLPPLPHSSHFILAGKMTTYKIGACVLLLNILQFCNAHKHISLRGGNHVEQARITALGSSVTLTTTTADDSSPTLTNCLLSAVNPNDCGTKVAGCIWCAEPIYGLCVSETAAKKLKVIPFFNCALRNVDELNMKIG